MFNKSEWKKSIEGYFYNLYSIIKDWTKPNNLILYYEYVFYIILYSRIQLGNMTNYISLYIKVFQIEY